MRADCFEPIVGSTFVVESRVVQRGCTTFVETRFLDAGGRLAVFAVTTMRGVSGDRTLGDA